MLAHLDVRTGVWEEPMRIVVDFSLCESNALCMDAAPEVFEVRDDDLLYVIDEEPAEELRAKVEQAVRVCPKQAITSLSRMTGTAPGQPIRLVTSANGG
jgi:ferredoxin